MITGYELIEKMYSENYDEYEDTRLYSTGDSDLDDLLEKAFCEGYEYAQREFGNPQNKAAKRAYEMKEGKKSMKGWLKNKDEAAAVKLGRESLQKRIWGKGDRFVVGHTDNKLGIQPLENIGKHRTSRGKLMQILDKKQMMKDLDENISRRGGLDMEQNLIGKKSPGKRWYDHK